MSVLTHSEPEVVVHDDFGAGKRRARRKIVSYSILVALSLLHI